VNKPILLAALSAFILIGAAYPAPPRLSYTIDLDGGATAATTPATNWRPCRRDRNDDRCIQLYERGVRAAYDEWRSAHGETRLAADRPQRRDRRVALAARCPEPASAARPATPARPGEGASISGM